MSTATATPMTARTRGILIAALLILVLAPLAVVLLLPDRLLEEIRPWLERVASDRLEMRVRIGRLSVQPLARGIVRIQELRLERDDAFRLDIPRLEAAFTVGGLQARRLESLRMEEPALTIVVGAEEGEPLPERLPLRVRRLQVTGGRVKVQTNGEMFRLREVEVTGALDDTSPFRAAAVAGEGEGIAVSAVGRAAWGRSPAITLDQAAWAGRPLLAAPLTVRLPEGTADGTLRLDRFDDRQLRILLDAFGAASPLPAGWSFALTAPEVRFRYDGKEIWADLRVPEATVASGELTLPLQEVAAEIAGRQVWQGAGTFRLAGVPGSLAARLEGERLTGSASFAIDDPGAFKRRLLGGDFPVLAGGLDLQATFSRGADGAIRVRGSARGRPGPPAAGALLDLARLGIELTAEQPAGRTLTGRARLLLRGREIGLVQGTPERLRAELRPAAGSELLELLPPSLRPFLPAASAGIGGAAELARDQAGTWRGTVRLQAARIPWAREDLQDLVFHAPVAFGGAGAVVGPATLAGRLQGEGSTARLEAAGTARMEQGDYQLQIDRFALSDVEYLAADGLTGLTAGTLEGAGTIAGREGDAGVRVDLDAVASARELLHGGFYADLTAVPLTLAVRGVLEAAPRRFAAERLALELPGIGRAELRGEAGTAAAAVGAVVTIPDLAATWAGPLGKAAAAMVPELAELRPAGAVEAGLALDWRDGAWRLAGEVRPQAVEFLWPGAALAARGIGGRFPFDLRSGEGGAAGETRRGELVIGELHLGPAALTAATVPLTALPNRLALGAPLVFSLAGGRVEVNGAEVALGAAGPEAAAGVRLREVDLRRLSREMGWLEMGGAVSADLGRMRYAGGTVVADGAMEIDAFGGRIRIGGLRLESLLSSYPSVQADVDFTGIDLQQLTGTFEFGEINGVADGHVRGLRLFGTVPSAFEALIETRESGRRNISVRALNNLSVISQGGFSSVLSRGIYRFIDFYRYRKIGIAGRLRNDVFTLYGTARPDSDRYLIYGGLLPPKIDVVATAHTISFKEMLRRLQRIERTETPENAAGN